jgi:hypothetical protein
MNSHQKHLFSCVLAIAVLLIGPSPAMATGVAPSLGSAVSFAVLGGTTVTNTITVTPTTINGDLGVSPGTAITGFALTNVIVGPGTVTPGTGIVTGTIHASDAVAAQAHSDAGSAYTFLVLQTCDFNYTGVTELGGRVLTPGVHCFASSAQVTGTLTLDFQGNPDAVFIFKIGSTLTTAVNSQVFVTNDGQNCDGANVFWAVGSSATIGVGTQFAGSILAFTSITLNTSATVSGRALAIGAAVTMDTNTVSVCGSGGTFPPPGAIKGAIKVTGGGQIPVPAPNNADPDAGGTGKATFGFNAQPDQSGSGAKGQFNYINHVTGLHINGPVNEVVVIAINPDGSPKTVRFTGSCKDSGPACAFSVTVEDRGEPGSDDRFGIAVTDGAPLEIRSQRVISKGNIQFHKN